MTNYTFHVPDNDNDKEHVKDFESTSFFDENIMFMKFIPNSNRENLDD